MEVLITGDGAWFYVSTPRFWSRLPPKRSVFHLSKHGIIWLYQVCAKILRAPATNEGFDELLYDLRASFDSSGTESMPWAEVTVYVADMLHKKGWVKT